MPILDTSGNTARKKREKMFVKEMTKSEALKTVCVSSDSTLTVSKCWCADCKEIRKTLRGLDGSKVIALITA